MSKSRTIRVDGQHLTGEWYGEDAAILKTNGHWQAVEVTIAGKDHDRTGVSGRLISHPQESVKDAQACVNEYRARKIMEQHEQDAG